MKRLSDPASIEPDELRARILGLGERSARKSYYPELRTRIAELERFRVALDESHDAILLAELPLGKLHDINETGCRMLCHSRSELLGRSVSDILPVLHDYLETADQRPDEHRDVIDTTLRTAEGGELPVRVSVCVVRIENIRYIAAVLHDTSEQQRAAAERELLLERERVARLQAERDFRLKDEFVATVSHELRTPLNAIYGWATLARRPGAPLEQVEKGLDVIMRNARLLAEIINDLLDVCRIASGKLLLDVARLDLRAAVEAAIDGLRSAADAKGVVLHTAFGSESTPVLGDARRLEQVVSNLVANAIKFTPPGGRVDVSLNRAVDRAVLDVWDTGQGIAPDFLPHIFERFRQADASAARRQGGLGLGLSIVKHVVDLHHGTVRVASAGPGTGARFTVELPMNITPLSPADSSECHELPDLSGMRILVVEDDADAREFVRRILIEQKAEVCAVASATNALTALQASAEEPPPDVLVCDIGLPGMDGYEFMRRIRGGIVPRVASTPAMALTAFARPEDHEEALRAGFQEHLAKPVEPAALVSVVARLAARTGFPERG